jgi:hypothetical protein
MSSAMRYVSGHGRQSLNTRFRAAFSTTCGMQGVLLRQYALEQAEQAFFSHGHGQPNIATTTWTVP